MSKFTMLLIVIFIFLRCKNASEIETRYSIQGLTNYDSIKVCLIGNLNDTLDIIKFKNYSSLLEDRYLKLKIDYSKGWSCLHIDSLKNLENTRRILMPYVKIEERFLNRIIFENNLNPRDKIEIIKYWKQLQYSESVTSIDDRWQTNLDSFKMNILYNTQ